MGVALLVFFLITKPPSPEISFKVVGFIQTRHGERLDNSGVVTKILTTSCSVNMVIDNNSKVFGLHIHPPALEMDFGCLKLAQSQGAESYVESKSSYVLGLHVAVKDMPVYGAGRSMQDMLESGQGLPLMIRVRSRNVMQCSLFMISSKLELQKNILPNEITLTHAKLKYISEQEHYNEVNRTNKILLSWMKDFRGKFLQQRATTRAL